MQDFYNINRSIILTKVVKDTLTFRSCVSSRLQTTSDWHRCRVWGLSGLGGLALGGLGGLEGLGGLGA